MAMRTIKFYGNLAKKFGSEHKVMSNTLQLGMKELMFKFPTLRKTIMKGQTYQFYVDKKRQTQDDLKRKLLSNEKVMHLVPAIVGGAIFTALYIIIAILIVGLGIMMSNMPNQDGTDKNKSFMFNGAINTNEQGGSVPLVYGRTRVGSVVISSGVYAETFGSWQYGGGGPSSGGGRGQHGPRGRN